MANSTVILVSRKSAQTDQIGNTISAEATREVFADILSVGANEFFRAGQKGLTPAFLIKVFFGDYEGEEFVRFDGITYTVYRTYFNEAEDVVEQYLSRKAAMTNGSNYIHPGSLCSNSAPTGSLPGGGSG